MMKHCCHLFAATASLRPWPRSRPWACGATSTTRPARSRPRSASPRPTARCSAHREGAGQGRQARRPATNAATTARASPWLGLDIIRGGKKAEGKDVWEGGKILDPENGKEYRASFTPIEGGKKLEVRGYLGPFWRTQTWNRVQ
jgi:hypothetical protein